jgi:hypothetical protein
MTERQKQVAIIGGTLIAALILMLYYRRTAVGAGATAGSDMLPAVSGPNLGPVVGGSSGPIIIPGLDLRGPNLNMIGACCSDCMQTSQGFTNPQYYGPAITINQGASGPTVYNNNQFTYGGGGYSGFDIQFVQR